MQQIKLLTFKNLLITFKNPKNIIFLIITPFILGTFLYSFQSLAVDNGNLVIPDPGSSPVSAYPKCGWSDCVSVDMRIVANSNASTIKNFTWISDLYDNFKANGYDVNVGSNIITNFTGLKSYYDELQQNPNKTQAGLLLCGDVTYLGTDDINNFCNTNTPYTYYLVLKKLNTMATIFHAIN